MNHRRECPKCGLARTAAATECAGCGVVFSKYDDAPRVRTMEKRAPVREADLTDDGIIGREEVKILGIGLVAAIVVYLIPITRMIFRAVQILFHEFGHAIVGWILGHPSLPAFDMVYGGGFTHRGDFHLSIAITVAVVFAYLIWTFRHNKRTLVLLLIGAAVWLIAVSSHWRREVAVTAAGHMFEFILAGIFFYQALSGVGWRSPEVERPLGAFVAFFVQIYAMMFAYRLRNDADLLSTYREGKGGAFMHDLEVLVLDFRIYLGIDMTIEQAAGFLLLFSFVPLTVAVAWHLYRSRVHSMADGFMRA